MPRKKRQFPKKYLVVIIMVIAVSGVGLVAWHDGLFGTTPLGLINDFTVSSGPDVVRGKITNIIGTTVVIEDGTGVVAFMWSGPATINTTVVVRGQVQSLHTLNLVSAVEPVWLFRIP